MTYGSPRLILGGARRDPAPPPIVGRIRARVAYPILDVEPDHRGPFGRAWACDLRAARASRVADAPRDALLAHWIIEAPWSHQIVHSYSLLLLHLQFMSDKVPVHEYMIGATHEVHLRPIRPDVPRARMLREPIDPRVWIEPTAFAAQTADANATEAESRLRRAVELVCGGRLSPHPAYAWAWAELFGDNMLRVAEASDAQA